MRAYARRHYGIDDSACVKPRVIVEHYTASNSFQSAYNTFAPERGATPSSASCPACARTT